MIDIAFNDWLDSVDVHFLIYAGADSDSQGEAAYGVVMLWERSYEANPRLIECDARYVQGADSFIECYWHVNFNGLGLVDGDDERGAEAKPLRKRIVVVSSSWL